MLLLWPAQPIKTTRLTARPSPRKCESRVNQKARELLQAQGALGPDELSVAGRGFATGDRVIGARNDRRAGILNGQRGTVLAIDRDQLQLEVVLDDGRSVRLGAEYLDAGHLEHGYAITAHRAQGATVDRTFVLGSEELYREWGYTALSRHRDQARFYIARTDLRPNPELPPSRDPLVAGITQLLTRSNAKELAIDALPHAEREQLERERRQLRERLEGAAPPRRLPHVERQEVEQEAGGLRNAREREHRLRVQLEQLRRRDRSRRVELERLLKVNLGEQQRRATRLGQAIDTVEAARDGDRKWLTTHAPSASRLLAVDHELRVRVAADHRAVRRL